MYWSAAAPTLVELHAAGNALNGSLPSLLGSLRRLASLQLQHNSLSGSLPPQLADARQLARLDVSYNALSGLLPPGLGQLLELAELHASGNAITGSLPDELAALPLLRSLQLGGNVLSGSLPAWLATPPRLRWANVSGNALSGRLPAAWWDASMDALPRLQLQRGELAQETRRIDVGGNPLLCPLPAWAAHVAADCHWVELTGCTVTEGTVQLTWANPALKLPGLGCLFGPAAPLLWVPAPNGSSLSLRCPTPSGVAAIVYLGYNSRIVSHSCQP